MRKKYILVGDIGGTNSNFGLFNLDDPTNLIASVHHKSQQVSDFTALISDICTNMHTQHAVSIAHIILGVAGIVIPGATSAKPTNLTVPIDGTAITARTGIPVALCNDFELVVWGSEIMEPKQQLIVQPGTPVEQGNKVYIGAGTGLGHALGIWDAHHRHYAPVATEAGHTDFASTTIEEWKLNQYVSSRLQRITTWEDVLSGAGMRRIYDFLGTQKTYTTTPLLQELTTSNLQPDKITAYASTDAQCAHTFALYQALYVRYAINAILAGNALGGLYIAGGIGARNPELFKKPWGFDRLPTELRAVPITLITDYNVSLYGGAVRAQQLLCDRF